MDLFSSEPILKCYRGHPSGNSPELCNIDSCLNIDLYKGFYCHVRYTDYLHQLYPKRFSIATPKKGTPAYLRIFDSIDGVDPSSE